MRSTIEYLAVSALALALALWLVVPVVESVAQSMDDSANMIAEASNGR